MLDFSTPWHPGANPPSDILGDLAAWLRFDPAPILFISPDQQLEWCNEAALALLNAGGPVSLRAGKVHLNDAEADARFKALVAVVGEEGWQAHIFSGEPGKGPAVLFARRVAKSRLVGIAIRDTQSMPGAQLDHLADYFNLTPAERQVLQHHVSGLSVAEIAAATGKAVLTVRTHIKRCYYKFEVTSKEQLFGLVMRLTF
jgi:DNA-binding CsgD family transcriptional regulator